MIFQESERCIRDRNSQLLTDREKMNRRKNPHIMTGYK